MSKSQEIAERRFQLAEIFRNFGMTPADSTAVAGRIQEDYLDTVISAIGKHAPQPTPGVALVQPATPAQPEPPKLWQPGGSSRKNIATVIAHGDWVEVLFTKVNVKENRTNLEGTCSYKEVEYSFTDTENTDVPEGMELIDYLVKNLEITKPTDLIGKRVWVQFIDKGKKWKSVSQFLTLEAYAKRFAS